MALLRLSLTSSMVSPCPLAPGTSGHTAQKPPSGAVSMKAVNSPFIIETLPVYHERVNDHSSPTASPIHVLPPMLEFSPKTQYVPVDLN